MPRAQSVATAYVLVTGKSALRLSPPHTQLPMSALPHWFPRSTFGLILAFIYLVPAVWIVLGERKGGSGGGWISLTGMASYLATLPVSFVGEMMGAKPDFRRNVDMAFAISVCSTLVYLLGAGIGKLARLMFSS